MGSLFLWRRIPAVPPAITTIKTIGIARINSKNSNPIAIINPPPSIIIDYSLLLSTLIV
jgi:hypothetical protein